jgi:hypothetical protein
MPSVLRLAERQENAQRPPHLRRKMSPLDDNLSGVRSETDDVDDDFDQGNNKLLYFPLSMPRMFGHLRYPPSELLYRTEKPSPTAPGDEATEEDDEQPRRKKKRKTAVRMPINTPVFPENITFRVADWVADPIPEDRNGYDLIIGSVFLSLFVSFTRKYLANTGAKKKLLSIEMDTPQRRGQRPPRLVRSRVRVSPAKRPLRARATRMVVVLAR